MLIAISLKVKELRGRRERVYRQAVSRKVKQDRMTVPAIVLASGYAIGVASMIAYWGRNEAAIPIGA
ncbi:hypothetical protein [Mesorhizobium huakuii]|uniref:Uncharacterized protein n=1 Tax=Mesorhizobium huakuii TaxID=28104 RepID=A0A7G6T091_9HYPH|nr:hypothetical protein [Mesorhizobium huakuii]QND60173.1 hypothetical protein HB778_29240 [Mesorhizobium huakuii]